MQPGKAAGRAALLVVLPLPIAAAVAGWWWWERRRTVNTLAQELANALPAGHRAQAYVRELATAAVVSAPGTPQGYLRRAWLLTWALSFAALVERESGWGRYLDESGRGDGGHGHGLGQVDDRPPMGRNAGDEHEEALWVKRRRHIDSGEWRDVGKHLLFCAREVLRGAWDLFADVPNPEDRLAAALAAYNAGTVAVRAQLAAGRPVDAVTTGKDYSADVLRRAEGWA